VSQDEIGVYTASASHLTYQKKDPTLVNDNKQDPWSHHNDYVSVQRTITANNHRCREREYKLVSYTPSKTNVEVAGVPFMEVFAKDPLNIATPSMTLWTTNHLFADTHTVKMEVYLKNYANLKTIETFKVIIDNCIVNSFTHAGNGKDPDEFKNKEQMQYKNWQIGHTCNKPSTVGDCKKWSQYQSDCYPTLTPKPWVGYNYDPLPTVVKTGILSQYLVFSATATAA